MQLRGWWCFYKNCGMSHGIRHTRTNVQRDLGSTSLFSETHKNNKERTKRDKVVEQTQNNIPQIQVGKNSYLNMIPN